MKTPTSPQFCRLSVSVGMSATISVRLRSSERLRRESFDRSLRRA
jgi:hypothetical protein